MSLEESQDGDWRYFATYSGVRLPLRLVTPIETEALSNRNTFIRARFDAAGRLLECQKLVYGEVELTHRYEYDADGTLLTAGLICRTLGKRTDCGSCLPQMIKIILGLDADEESAANVISCRDSCDDPCKLA